MDVVNILEFSRLRSFAQDFGNDVDDDCAAETAAEQQVNQRILGRRDDNGHLCDQLHLFAPQA
jgi:hypothetical protein